MEIDPHCNLACTGKEREKDGGHRDSNAETIVRVPVRHTKDKSFHILDHSVGYVDRVSISALGKDGETEAPKVPFAGEECCVTNVAPDETT